MHEARDCSKALGDRKGTAITPSGWRIRGPLVACLCLFLSPGAFAQENPGLTLPVDFKCKPGEFLRIQATTTAQVVRWVILDDGPSLFPPELLVDKRSCVFVSLKAGKFRVLAYGAIGGEPTQPAITTVCVGEVPKPPPPTPPTPPPPPPDPLAVKFQAAFTADPNALPIKTAQRDALIGLYQAMAEHAKDSAIQNTEHLLGDLRRTADKLLQKDVLNEVRKIISVEVGGALTKNPAAVLDDVTRRRAIDVFTRVHTSLSSVK